MKDISFSLAFLAGVLSFLSPCVLPLIPSYVSFITGVSFEKLASHEDRARVRKLTIVNSLFFIGGFSSVFIALGASSSYLGTLLFDYQDWLRIGGGVLIIVFGLFIAGFLKLDFLMKEKKFHLHGRPAGYAGAFLIGMTFAAGWTPCIGPILGSILLYASTKGSAAYGLKLLAVYSLGLALPFLIASLAINTFLSRIKAFYRFMRVIMVVSGLILIAFGIMLLSNQVSRLAALFPDLGIRL
ncbi:MAG: cytochrome c biogenesis protein CcdA [Thermodesulfovibrionales bacterium]|nr:cytochrome c biogenesis protein CcdA [Thermodesulfovibrionales bacterium]